MAKFRLRDKCGTHVEPSTDGTGDWFVQPGQVVEGKTDLARRFPEKFDKAKDDARVTASFINKAADGAQDSLAGVAAQASIHENKTPAKAPANKPSDAEIKDTLATVNEMTVAELKSYAEDEEIDISHAKTKADLLATIEKSIKGE